MIEVEYRWNVRIPSATLGIVDTAIYLYVATYQRD